MASTADVEGRIPLSFQQLSFQRKAHLKVDFNKFRAKRLRFDLPDEVKEDQVNADVPYYETAIAIPCGSCCFVGGIILIIDCLRRIFCCLFKQIRQWHYQTRVTYENEGDSSCDNSLDDAWIPKFQSPQKSFPVNSAVSAKETYLLTSLLLPYFTIA